MIDNYDMFRIGTDGAWMGLTAEGQDIKDSTGAGGPAEGATASIEPGNIVKIVNEGYEINLTFNDGQEDAAQEFVDGFNFFANPVTPSE